MKIATLFLAGDVMTGRGLDQVMQHSVAPRLHEPGVRDARHYLALAEAAHGSIPAPVSPAYLWGDALAVIDEYAPDARIINLETSITTSDDWCRAKQVHYRMHPANIGYLAAAGFAPRVAAVKQPGDIAVISIHWGSNWGFGVPDGFVAFAHRLIDGGVDLVHGHSSHHVRPIEVYRDRLILYGCGDLIDDYEGIAGHGRYRSDLGLMYFPALEIGTGRLVGLAMVPMRMKRFQPRHVDREGVHWLGDTLARISRGFGCSAEIEHQSVLSLRW